MASWIFQESRWKITATNPKTGAIGLTQLMPETGQEWAERLNIELESKATLYDPVINLKIGFAYLSHMRDRFKLTHRYVTAYFWGPQNTIDHKLNKTDYSKEVIARAKFYKE